MANVDRVNSQNISEKIFGGKTFKFREDGIYVELEGVSVLLENLIDTNSIGEDWRTAHEDEWMFIEDLAKGLLLKDQKFYLITTKSFNQLMI